MIIPLFSKWITAISKLKMVFTLASSKLPEIKKSLIRQIKKKSAHFIKKEKLSTTAITEQFNPALMVVMKLSKLTKLTKSQLMETMMTTKLYKTYKTRLWLSKT